MKRLHIHISVNDLPENIRFYAGLFDMPPTIEKYDYAKWVLDNPCVNFAISTRAAATGVNHLGIQVDSAQELAQLEQRARMAGITSQPETGAT